VLTDGENEYERVTTDHFKSMAKTTVFYSEKPSMLQRKEITTAIAAIITTFLHHSTGLLFQGY